LSSSTKKAFQILEMIAQDQGKMKLIDISKQLKLNKTTALRYIQTLEELDLIIKTDNYYSLGYKMLWFGYQARNNHLFLSRITPILREYVQETNETINIAQYINNRLVYIQRVESGRNLQLKAQPGMILPFHCTSLGKAVLSILPKEEQNDLIYNKELTQYTEKTITQAKDLEKEIIKTEKQGFSIEMEEFEEGLACGAIPLNLTKINFIGALSFSGYVNRLSEETITTLLKNIKIKLKSIEDIFS